MRLSRNLLVYTLLMLAAGCAKTDSGFRIETHERANPWTHLNLNNDVDNFQFAIVSDRTGHHRPGVFAQAVEKLNLLNPEFVMCVGDLIEGGTEDENELKRQWDKIDDLVNKLRAPFFYLAGNHDIGNEVMADIWQKRQGQSYYHFTYRNTLFLCLNTEDPPRRSISEEQFEYFRKVLGENRDVRWTMVFMHEPLWLGETSENWPKLESLLASRPYTVFAGHEHTYEKSLRKGRSYYLLATTGAGNPTGLDECKFDHVVWMTMTDDGPVMANLLLEGILNNEPCP